MHLRLILFLFFTYATRNLSNCSTMRSFKLHKIKLKLLADTMNPFIPSLEIASKIPHHKGQHGRIAVIGGSEDYTGAPYYAGISSLKLGAELAFVFCAKEAAIPIKTYSPELMVTPFYSSFDLEELSNIDSNSSFYTEKVQSLSSKVIQNFSRFNSLVIGPGLGRNKYVLDIVTNIIIAAVDNNIPFVIDADGIYLLRNSDKLLSSILTGYKRCILTPNAIEFEALIDYVVNKSHFYNNNEDTFNILKSKDTSDVIRLKVVSSLLNLTIIRKGPTDYISSGNDVFALADNVGSPRRCGGQGDILSGCLALALHWCTPAKSLLFDAHGLFATSPLQPLLPELSTIIERDNDMSFDVTAIFDLPEEFSEESRYNGTETETTSILASLFATYITRKASESAFNTSKRSTLSSDIIGEIGEVMNSFEKESIRC